MRSWLPQRPLSGPEVIGIVVVSFMVLPLLIGGVLSLVTAMATWPAVLGLLAGGAGALLVQRVLAREVVVGRRRIVDLERENDDLRRQVSQLGAAVDRFIDQHDAPR